MERMMDTPTAAWRNGEIIRTCAPGWTKADLETYRAAYIKAYERPEDCARLRAAADLGIPALIHAIEDADFDRIANQPADEV